MDKEKIRQVGIIASALIVTALIAGTALFFLKDAGEPDQKQLSQSEIKSLNTFSKDFAETAGTFGVKIPATMDNFIKFHIDVLGGESSVVTTREANAVILADKFAFTSSTFNSGDDTNTLADLDEVNSGVELVGFTVSDIKVDVPEKYLAIGGDRVVDLTISAKTKRESLLFVDIINQDGSPNKYGKDNWIKEEASAPFSFKVRVKAMGKTWKIVKISDVTEQGVLSFDNRFDLLNPKEVARFSINYPKLDQYGDILLCLTTGEECAASDTEVTDGQELPPTDDSIDEKAIDEDLKNKKWGEAL